MIDMKKMEEMKERVENLKNSRIYKSKSFLSKSSNTIMRISKKIIDTPKGGFSQEDCKKFRKQIDSMKSEMERLITDKILFRNECEMLQSLIPRVEKLITNIENRLNS